MTNEIIVGMMSGTSIDGIDAAAVRFATEQRLELIDTHFIEFERHLKNSINQLVHSQGQLVPQHYQSVDHQLAQLYAQASLELIEKSGITTKDVVAIANHGQTIRHQPNANPPLSLQLGDAQRIANLTGIQTIGQFRQGDLKVGGQGAPLMPAFHQAVFSNNTDHNRYLLNIGGIANITRLAATNQSMPVIGFDTGPGNTLLDQWISRHQSLSYDHDGNWAASGRVVPAVLDQLLDDPYFKLGFPKSTGTDYFNLTWARDQAPGLNSYPPQNIQATFLQLTVETIRAQVVALDSSEQNTASRGSELYVCGGGARNHALMIGLRDTLPMLNVRSTNDIGIPPDWVEAMGFAWLGYCHLHGIKSNLPNVTGASQKVVLGECFQPKQVSA
jgi:anhydro-N-acetylmuramic acid kinase